MPTVSSDLPSTPPLKGLRVLSLTVALAGPLTARTLAQLGAEVIKLESHNGGLDSFRFYSATDDIQASGRFLESNLNVLSAQLNLKTEVGIRLFLELVERSDVLIENFRPHVLPKLGLGPERLMQVKPDIIYLKLPGMGSTGPKSWFGTWGQTLNAVSGMTYLWNHPDQPRPVGFQGAYPDYVAAALAPTAIISALLRRRRTGKGAFLELAQAELAAYMLGVNFSDALVNSRNPLPQGNDAPHAAPHGCYPCRGEDRWCVIAVETEAQWRNLCIAIGSPELLTDGRFVGLVSRRNNRSELDAIITRWTADREAGEVMSYLQETGVPCGVVQTGEDLYKDPQLRSRNLVREVDGGALGRVPVTDLPLHFSETVIEEPRAMRPLGADNEHVFCEILGYDHAELASWQNAGIVK